MIIDLNEARVQARRVRAQQQRDREIEDELQDSREASVRYQILLARIKETLARC